MKEVLVRPRGRRTLLRLLADKGIAIPSDCGGAGTCGKCRVRVRDAAGVRHVLACRFAPETELKVRVPPPRRAGTGAARVDPGLRLAADFGTTTISLAAVDAVTGRVRARQDVLNPQVVFGADVMTRIVHLRRVRRLDLTGPAREFCRWHGIGRSRAAVAVGNTVVTHFLLGQSPAGLGRYPYRSRMRLRVPLSGKTPWKPSLRVRVPALLGSFVGADCAAAILASGLHRSARLGLLVDAGTNGEVVLGNRDRLLVCSTAAGPAFEGATLECGSLARPGAIVSVRTSGAGFEVRTIGNRPARTVCGSGVLSATSAGLATGRILASGRLRDGNRLVLAGTGENEVYLSQADLREVQLAKAAVAAGIRLLLEAWPAAPPDVELVFLTGRFGAAIDPKDASRVGLLPEGCVDRVRRHGNVALRGAVMLCQDRSRWREVQAIARATEEVTLGGQPGFEEAFVQAMELAPWR